MADAILCYLSTFSSYRRFLVFYKKSEKITPDHNTDSFILKNPQNMFIIVRRSDGIFQYQYSCSFLKLILYLNIVTFLFVSSVPFLYLQPNMLQYFCRVYFIFPHFSKLFASRAYIGFSFN